MLWRIQNPSTPQTLESVKDVLLENRGIDLDGEVAFFSPKHPLDIPLDDVHIDPAQMSRAVQRILKAKQDKEYVVVFGDYDADGVTATTILWETLYEMGVKAMPFIPHREKHGYGISDRSLDDLLKEKKPDLIITVDNGIVAHAAFQRLQQEGIDAIITDHHLPETKNGVSHFPHAYAIIHSTKLCGATVAWFLARELQPRKAGELLDLCAIGTIADQMILTNANRSFATHGLALLKKTQRVGLQNMFQLAGIDQQSINSYSVNFVIAPRINAMGRLGSALDALRALCTKDQQKSLALMQTLNDTNSQRQELTWSMVEQAIELAKQQSEEHLLVVASPEYHEGVVGLIAGKLMEEYYKPTIAISVGLKIAKASARSVPGVNIVEMIRAVRSDLLDVGGHPMAAGFSLLPEKVEVVTQKLFELAKQQIPSELLTPSQLVECELPIQLVNVQLVNMLKSLEPFGNGNPDPVFGLKNLEIFQLYSLGKERKHLKMVVGNSKLGVSFECIAFGMGNMEGQLNKSGTIDIAGTIGINEWNGKKSIQVVVKDIEKPDVR